MSASSLLSFPLTAGPPAQSTTLMKCVFCGCSVDERPLHRTAPLGESPAGWGCVPCIEEHLGADFLDPETVAVTADLAEALGSAPVLKASAYTVHQRRAVTVLATAAARGEATVTPRRFAELFYTNSALWAGCLWLAAGSYLGRLRKSGLVEHGTAEGTHQLTATGRALAELLSQQTSLPV